MNKEMNLFIGTKIIKASTEMSRQEYCDYRGWKLPENENGEDRVYLVEYEVDETSKPNHPNHEGYISMSPKTVFEKAYIKIKTISDIKDKELFLSKYDEVPAHQQRVLQEVSELDSKIEKLDSFIMTNPIFKTLDETEQNRLIQQVRGIQYYVSILVERINNF